MRAIARRPITYFMFFFFCQLYCHCYIHVLNHGAYIVFVLAFRSFPKFSLCIWSKALGSSKRVHFARHGSAGELDVPTCAMGVHGLPSRLGGARCSAGCSRVAAGVPAMGGALELRGSPLRGWLCALMRARTRLSRVARAYPRPPLLLETLPGHPGGLREVASDHTIQAKALKVFPIPTVVAAERGSRSPA